MFHSELLYPANYVTFLANEIITVLDRIESLLMAGSDCSVQFVGQLIGKICFVGYAGVLLLNKTCNAENRIFSFSAYLIVDVFQCILRNLQICFVVFSAGCQYYL